MESQMKIKLEQKRKRGRPTGRNRVPLSAEERRARNAQYERERRDQQAEAIAELADAMGCDPNMSNRDIIATVVNYLGGVSSRNAISNDDLRRQNETMLREIGLFKQQWGLSTEDESSDTSDSGVVVESADSESDEYDSGDSSSRSDSKPYSTSSGCSQSSASCGQGPASFDQGSARHETVLGINQGPVSGSQTTSYDQACAAYNQSAAKRLKTSDGYVEDPVSYGDSASYAQLQPPASFKQERASDEESCTRYVQESADYSPVAVSYGQGSASYVELQPPVSYKQELESDEEGTAGCNQGSARTSPYVKSGKNIKLERAASAASFVSETSPKHQHGPEGSMAPGLVVEPSVGSAGVPQGSRSHPNTFHQAPPHPWTRAPQTSQVRYLTAFGVPSPQALQVPSPQISPSSDPWIDTLIRTYLG